MGTRMSVLVWDFASEVCNIWRSLMLTSCVKEFLEVNRLLYYPRPLQYLASCDVTRQFKEASGSPGLQQMLSSPLGAPRQEQEAGG
jgi:hypothetical protein